METGVYWTLRQPQDLFLRSAQRLGLVRFCLARAARGSPRLARAATRAFGGDAALAVQRIAEKFVSCQPKTYRRIELMVAAEEFHDPRTVRRCITRQCCTSWHGDIARRSAAGRAFGRSSCVARHSEWQRDLTQLSSRGRQLVASGCGHWIHLDRPEWVIQAIRAVVVGARLDSKLEPKERKNLVNFPL